MYTEGVKQRAEIDILAQAMNAVARETGLHLRIEERDVKRGQREIDAVLAVEGRKERLEAEVKRWAPQANLGAVINRILALPMKGVLVADYVNPKMAEKLRERQVQFIDTAGNAYIDLPPVYILVIGKRKPNQVVEHKGGTNRAFDRAGLKVVFAFLCHPELIAAPYRQIADTAGVALGTVGWVINGLKTAGFIFEYGKKEGREIIEYKRLLDRWVETYPEKLRPKVHLGDFYADDPHWWKEFDIKEFQGYWGGEIAAARYTKYLQPVVATLYLPKETKSEFLARARLKAAPKAQFGQTGIVELYHAFWQTDGRPFVGIGEPDLVPPVLAYADLIATANPRNLEVAGMIYDEYIARYNR